MLPWKICHVTESHPVTEAFCLIELKNEQISKYKFLFEQVAKSSYTKFYA